jgi:hypothetical protein
LALAAILLVLALVISIAQSAPASAQGAAFVFTVLGPSGPVARAITSEAACPQITIDGQASEMQLRAGPDANFPVRVCDAAIPPNAQGASIGGEALKLPRAELQRVVIVGDTGCRLKGDRVQSCNDPAQWPWARIADRAAAAQPDVVIHVGDYNYRESPCILDKANCAGSPYGENWAAWSADVFTPAANLLKAAPWVAVRGNHEDCERGGDAFFRLLDPRPMPASCPDYTDPYALDYVSPQLLVMDDSVADDFEVRPDQLSAFQGQFAQLNQLARGTSWLLVHDPIYVFGHLGVKDGKEELFIDQKTLQQASNNTFPPSVQLIASGHIHLFQVLSFDKTRPPQLVVGNSGTLLDPPITTPLKGLDMAGKPVEFGTHIDKFGYVVAERNGAEWALAVQNLNGSDLDRCRLGGGALLCGQAAIPRVGGDLLVEYQRWLGLALFGAAVILLGLALRVHAFMRPARTG